MTLLVVTKHAMIYDVVVLMDTSNMYFPYRQISFMVIILLKLGQNYV